MTFSLLARAFVLAVILVLIGDLVLHIVGLLLVAALVVLVIGPERVVSLWESFRPRHGV